jgi:hypothetical protein
MLCDRCATRSKPGGIMVCEEADISAIYTEPPTDGYHSIKLRLLTEECWREMAHDMRKADEDPNVLVARARTGQLICGKPI